MIIEQMSIDHVFTDQMFRPSDIPSINFRLGANPATTVSLFSIRNGLPLGVGAFAQIKTKVRNAPANLAMTHVPLRRTPISGLSAFQSAFQVYIR
jgi:hypothetical protein